MTDEKIRITPVPEWADADLKSLMRAESPDEHVSILDTDLVPKTAEVFRNVGFVERVRSIEKSKTGLDIELVYRQPVAVVELSEVTFPKKWPAKNRGKRVLLPVDRQGVLMPESIGAQQQLPIITIPFPSSYTELTTWQHWPDERIRDAAAISSQFQQPLSQLGIARIVTTHYLQSDEQAQETNPFELYSGSGTRIVWGNAPGKERKGEATVEQKLNAIMALIQQHGALNQVNLGRVDIQTGSPVAAGPEKTAKKSDEIFSELK